MRIFHIMLFTILAGSLSCANQVELASNKDDTAPTLELTLNTQTLKSGDEVNHFPAMPTDGIIKVFGRATDEESGIQKISVGTSLTFQCESSDKEYVYAGVSDFPPRNKAKAKSGDKVKKSRNTTLNFRLWEMRKACGEKPLAKAEGQIYVYARNYVGKLSSNTYNVSFIPANKY